MRALRGTGRFALMTGVVLVATAVAASAASAAPAPPPCPASAVVTQSLDQKIVKVASSVVAYNDGQGVNGQRRTCNYTTKTGGDVLVELSTGAQVLAFVDAEDSATDLPTGYENHSHVTKQIVPVFGLGNDAWALKPVPGQNAVLAALYHTRSIVITAPKADIGQLEALAKATFGIPVPDEKNV